ncbi:unnamed protein product [Pseudo-nitzschia multistriata]|uniref:DNA topoisomerase n=1 Tax=Pseudo-nitzschia multistriata TaxID=183589 RepID=A0A448ZNI2_9STRA|nr:unnamed protein product [Pseudo-nitzschia multistriata]
MIAVVLPMQSTRRRLFSNALLSGSNAFTRKPSHSTISKYLLSIPSSHERFPLSRSIHFSVTDIGRRRSYTTQEQDVHSTTSLSAAKTNFNTFSLVVQGPPTFSFPKKNKKSQRPFKLVVVESPSKCQTISKILQKYVKDNDLAYDFVLTSSMGHIRNIPQKKSFKGQKIAGIDLENNYSPTYEVIEGKEDMLSKLQELSAAAQQLILATDDDREGEAMAWHLLQVLEGEGNPFINTSDAKGKVAEDKQHPLRVRFTEITKKAIVEAIENPETSLRDNLVEAQQARRILDRLAGFTVSPVLWKKIAPGLSAGRVQSVGMAMTVQRERERLTFQRTEYWGVKANFSAFDDDDAGQLFETNLISINGQVLASGTSDFDPKQSDQLTPSAKNKLHLTEQSAAEFTNLIQTKGDQWSWKIDKITSKERKQKAPVPFITSSLQQEANRRLGLSVSGSMRSAQQLYEKGFISYMRTDSTHLSEDAQNAIREEIIKDLGGPDNYVAATENSGKISSKSSKNKKPDPQAAHEAIRPAVGENGRFLKPELLPLDFDKAAVEVYRLIYQRTVASHMTPQISNQTSISITGLSGDEDETEVLFRTSGSVVVDPGYTRVYPRQADSKAPILPPFEEGQSLSCDSVRGLSHTTQPPARYTEASFIQELEAQGVGRPSTYAGTVKSLRDRCYIGSPINSDANRRGGVKEVSGPAISAQRAAGGEDFTGSKNGRGPLVPSLSAFVVTSLLEKHCEMYVDPTFTAKMEERLDRIANSEVEVSENERVSYLSEFYEGEEGLASKIEYIDNNVDADIARRADLPALAWNSTQNSEDIGLFIGPWGPYVMKTSASKADDDEEKVVKASLPPGMASDISTITLEGLDAVLKTKEQDGLILGQHPEDGRNIRLKVGPYGGYLQWGEDGDDEKSTHTLPREYRSFKKPDLEDMDGESGDTLADMIGLSLEKAIQYVNLPRTVCLMNDLPIVASIGPYGPYLKYNNTFMQLKPKDGDVITIDGDLAQVLVTDGIINKKSKFGAGVLAEIGEKDEAMITVKRGRFGAYINWNQVNAKLPSEYIDDPSELSLEEAWTLIQQKAASSPGKRTKKKTTDIEIPPGPKRPPSSYFLFTAEKRPEVSAAFSSLGEVSKELGRLWSSLSDDEKKPYVEKAAIAKAAYDVEKAQWQKETKQLRRSKKGNTAARGSSMNGPKRPRSAYIFFCKKNRDEVSKDFKKLGDISKELGRRWNDIDAAAKAEYVKMAEDDKHRYTMEMEEGVGSSGTKTKGVSKTKKRKVKVTKKTSKTGKQKRSPSAYMLFCASHRSQIVDENGQKLKLPETTKILAQMWRECDDETRARFVQEAENQKAVLH